MRYADVRTFVTPHLRSWRDRTPVESLRASSGKAIVRCVMVSCLAGPVAGCERASELGDADADAGATFVEGYASPEVCAGCHPAHYEQWRVSSHAYASADPVFRAMVELGQAETEGELGSFCVECHAPIAARTGQAAVYKDPVDGRHRQDLDGFDEAARHGVSCDVCHTLTRVQSFTENAGFETVPDGTRRARIEDPVPNAFHRSEYGDQFGSARMCAPCHNLFSEFFSEPVRLESTFREWQVSRFNGMTTCQGCHMPPATGAAAVDGPQREIHDHTMVGVDVSLLPPEDFPGYEALRAATAELLQRSAEWTWEWDASTRRFSILIENLAGHALPSGSTADREMWIELRVVDADGALVFESGALDARGDLKDDSAEHTLEPGADPQLVLLRQRMRFDPALEGEAGEVRDVHFLWEPNTFEERLIGAGGVLPVEYDLSMLPPGDYEVRGRLLFRTYPPYLLRKLVELDLLDPEVPKRVPLVEMETLSESIRVAQRTGRRLIGASLELRHLTR